MLQLASPILQVVTMIQLVVKSTTNTKIYNKTQNKWKGALDREWTYEREMYGRVDG